MSEERPQGTPPSEGAMPHQEEPPREGDWQAEETWREVGSQFQALGESLADAFKSAWERPENQQLAREMRDSLEDIVNRLGDAIKESGTGPEAQRVHHEARRTTQSLRAAGEQTWREARPRVLEALRQLSAELDRLAERLRGRPAASPTEGPPAEE